MADYSGRVTKTAFSRSAGVCPPQCQLSESGFSGCPRWSRIFKICKIHRIFLSPSLQDQAILRYREGWCGGGRRALLRLDSSSRRALLVSVRFRWTDAGEGQALALRYKGRCCGPVARGPVPRARCGRARPAPVVRDRLIANRSGSGDPALQRGVVRRR